ncbi:MAG: polyprenyl synthetase family protein [Gemmatimonadota bacterium]|nr:polyprenyl synthetase family protein [Gemmatimonadota bacterium]
MTGTLEAFTEAERPRVEAAVAEAIARLAPPVGAVARYSVGGGGKRLRPLLTVASHRAVGGARKGIHAVAAAVELVHTYSLLHDDLPTMDDDGMRRGLPTAHVVYGPAAATAAGAALQQRAFLLLADAAGRDFELAPALPRLIRRLARAAGVEGMVGGQYLDLEAEGRDVDPAGLEAIHRAKTGALISAACAMGAIAAGASEERVDALSDYGASLGLAFQVVDDLLDELGEPSRTGKAAGADAARRKATYPSVHGIEGARDQAEAAADVARDALERLDGDAEGVNVLREYVDFVVERLH